MLEVSRDAVAAGEEQLVSCAAEKSKYCSICTVTLDPCGDLPFTSGGRWQCLRGPLVCGANTVVLGMDRRLVATAVRHTGHAHIRQSAGCS